MLKRIRKLLSEPAFREEPLAVIGRGASLAALVALGKTPVFDIVPGVKLKVPADFRYTSVATFLLRDKIEPELRYLGKFLKKGDVFVDVGANIGMFTLKGASLAGRVVSVEPGEAAGDLLCANVELNGFSNVTVVRKALADAPGKAALFHNPVGDDPQAFSLINDGNSTESEDVPVTTLDQVLSDLGITKIDCIKIDVEGAEARVIAGGMNTLRASMPVIVFELNCPTLIKGGGDAAEAWNALAGLGYSFFQLEEDGALRPLAARPTEFGDVVGLPPGRAAA